MHLRTYVSWETTDTINEIYFGKEADAWEGRNFSIGIPKQMYCEPRLPLLAFFYIYSFFYQKKKNSAF